jgi:glyoxylase-like metal-dependent hydrolase (beta-lactamase superfamily II)
VAKISQIADGIWRVRRPSYLACSYLVRSEDGFVAVDAGMDSAGKDLIQALATAGARVGDLRAILLTHWHNDNSAGAAALASGGVAI